MSKFESFVVIVACSGSGENFAAFGMLVVTPELLLNYSICS
jgi:hypothetical protein